MIVTIFALNQNSWWSVYTALLAPAPPRI